MNAKLEDLGGDVEVGAAVNRAEVGVAVLEELEELEEEMEAECSAGEGVEISGGVRVGKGRYLVIGMTKVTQAREKTSRYLLM